MNFVREVNLLVRVGILSVEVSRIKPRMILLPFSNLVRYVLKAAYFDRKENIPSLRGNAITLNLVLLKINLQSNLVVV